MARSHGKRFLGIPDEFWVGFVIMVGFFLKLVYVIEIGYGAGTPAAGVWEDLSGGHFAGGRIEVIHYLFAFHHFPDFSPAGLAGYADPPLFYIICSLVLEVIHRLMGWTIGVCMYVLLLMNVVFVMIGECCAIGILQKFGVRGRKLVVAILFLIFFPTFYHLAGALDGSALGFMLSMLALNSALSWFGSRRKKTLIRTAVQLGLGFMTSYTTFAVVPAILVLLHFAVSDGRRNETPLRIQYRQFAIIACILGLIWPVYLTVRFHLPLFYIEPAGVRTAGSALSRLLPPGKAALSHLHTVGAAPLESNIWAQTFKTAVFDLKAVSLTQRGTRFIAVFLLWLTIALCLTAHVMLMYTIFAAGRIDRVFRRLLSRGYLAALAGYVIMCLAVPYTEVMNFRYVAVLLIFPLTGMSVCGSGDLSDNLFEKVTTGFVNAIILVLAFITAFLFGFYA